MITSKRHPINFYFPLVFTVVMLTGIAFLSIGAAYEDDSLLKIIFAVIFSIIISTFLYYFVKLSFDDSPIIKLDKDKISFDGLAYSLREIDKIEYTGKHRTEKHFLRINYGEGARIYFKDGTTRTILDNTYSNTHEIKLYLKETVGKGGQTSTQKAKAEENLKNSTQFQEYKGYQFLSFSGVYILLIVGPAIYALLFKIEKLVMPNFLFFTIAILLWTILCSYFLHYFRLSANHLVIKNHNLFWKKDTYNLSDIKEVVFEASISARFGATGLRLITKDLKSKLYQADSLSNKKWLKLKSDLEKHGIRVRNECISRD